MRKHFSVGLGTARLPIKGANDSAGFEKSVELICHAINNGVDYIDSSDTYAGGIAQSAIGEAFRRTGKSVATTLKCNYEYDKTYDAVMARVEKQLKALGVDRTDYFLCWTIKSLQDFEGIMRKGGMYDTAVKLKENGIIRNICFSTHAPAQDTIEILKTGLFDGMTISYSILNGIAAKPVLDVALEYGVDAIVMNPLGGGLIPQNADYFKFARMTEDETIIQAAMRYCFAHPAIKIVLCGVQSIDEFDENFKAITEVDKEKDIRCEHVNNQAKSLENFCTGCHYCDGCPVNIPTANYMQARNKLLFNPAAAYNCDDDQKLRYINLFKSLFYDQGVRIGSENNFFDAESNPCIKCGMCNNKCTQHLDIRKAMNDLFECAKKVSFSMGEVRKRFENLMSEGPKRVGVIPSGAYTSNVLDLYKKAFGEIPFEIVPFNNNPELWGSDFYGEKVQDPAMISELGIDMVLVTHFAYGQEIYSELKKYETDNLHIKCLHETGDVPWFY